MIWFIDVWGNLLDLSSNLTSPDRPSVLAAVDWRLSEPLHEEAMALSEDQQDRIIYIIQYNIIVQIMSK